VRGLEDGAPMVTDAMRDVLRLEAPAGAAYRSSGAEYSDMSARSAGFDYDRLETIVRGLNLVMVANEKVIAQVTARQNKIQSDNEAKRMALATGRR